MAANIMVKYVSQKTVMAFCFLEFCYGAGMCAIWWRFSGVQELGKFLHTWQFFYLLMAFRCFSGLWGMIGAYQRRIFTTKLYWYFLIFNVPTTLIAGIPWFRLTCSCSENYRQCVALLAFQKKSLFKTYPVTPEFTIINRWSPPDKPRFASIRKVPYKRPPKSPLPPNGKSKASAELELGPSWTSSLASIQASRGSDTLPGASWFSGKSKQQEEEANLLAMFNISEEGIAWKSDVKVQQKHCLSKDEPIHVNAYEAEYKAFHALFNSSWEAKSKIDLPQALINNLYLCSGDLTCGVVRMEIWEGTAQSYFLSICNLDYPTTPVMMETAYKDDKRKFALRMFLQVNEEVKQDVEVGGAAERDLEQYKMVFSALSTADGMTMLSKGFAETCHCEDERDNCMVWGETREQHWCWVARNSIDACLAENVQIYHDVTTEKYWSKALCKKRGCECSNQGMAVENEDASVNRSALWQNGMDYGMTCRKWNTDIKNPAWCYVGFDTTCVDRQFDNAPIEFQVPGILGQRHAGQYWSAIPCIALEKQHRNEDDAWRICMYVMVPAIMSCLFVSALGPPMSYIVLKFLAKRCGDDFQVEEQFAVDFSDEDAEFSSSEEEKPASDSATKSEGDAVVAKTEGGAAAAAAAKKRDSSDSD